MKEATLITASSMAMASTVRVTLASDELPEDLAHQALQGALAEFRRVEEECSRYLPTSDLSRANAAPDRWHAVSQRCFLALREAYAAYRATDRRFDPRLVGDGAALGYERPTPRGRPAGLVPRSSPAAWLPLFLDASRRVNLGGRPVDLGWIGKGLGVRWASQTVGRHDHLVEAGGACYCAGRSPDGGPWRLAVEDPTGDPEPLAVLALTGQACATSSVRTRHWETGGRWDHHLGDPASGQPAGTGLLAVSVVTADAVDAEVWSKVLLLAGPDGVRLEVDRRGLAAAWVTDDGALHVNRALAGLVLWRR